MSTSVEQLINFSVDLAIYNVIVSEIESRYILTLKNFPQVLYGQNRCPLSVSV